MNLQKFGKLMKLEYGSIPGDLLSKLYDFYTEDQEEFENKFTSLTKDVGTKGCFLYENISSGAESFIIFGAKYFDKEENAILISGTIMARGKDCPYLVGEKIQPNEEIINQFIMLDSAGLVTKISDLEMITAETDTDDKEIA